MSLSLTLAAVVVFAISGVPGLFLSRKSGAGQYFATLLAVIGAGLGLAGAGMALMTSSTSGLEGTWTLPGGNWRVTLDALGAVFLVPVFLQGALGSVYGQGYWRQAENPENGRYLRVFWGVLVASMALVVLAGNGVVFLIAWEIMALGAFLLIVTEDSQEEVRKAGWIYLVCTHLGTLALFALFALLHFITGSFTLRPLLLEETGLGLLSVVFFLAVFGFGFKAGIMPLHFWLPGAHAAAPSHVSALLSGVLLKVGIYGLIRICSLLPSPPVSWGALLIFLGMVSGVLGVLFALGQHDLKRLLAYHSIENIGIIVMGLGLAMVGRSLGRPLWVVLGMGGCLLHVWNHFLFKSLLFLGAGSVVHGTHTREIDRLGGLARRMPATAFFFLVGAVSICGLPPLNGFISELLIYLGSFQTLGLNGQSSWGLGALIVPALCLTGALAVACFVKVSGAVFLGMPRTPEAGEATESPAVMVWPMGILAALCAGIGLFPAAVSSLLDHAVVQWWPEGLQGAPALAEVAPLRMIGNLGLVLLGLCGVLWILSRSRSLAGAQAGTWDCGYARPTPKMQYTASSFAQTLVRLFGWALRPRFHFPVLSGLFPRKTRFGSHVDDPVLDEVLHPLVRYVAEYLGRVRFLQHGFTQIYIVYILITLVVLLLWQAPLNQYLLEILGR